MDSSPRFNLNTSFQPYLPMPKALLAFLLRCLTALAVSAIGLSLDAAGPDAAEANQERFFESDVRRILKTHCWHCHGEENEVQAKLDLRWVRGMLTGGESGPAITAGAPETSLLWQRVHAGEMPPGGKVLSDKEKAILQQWIIQGGRTLRPEPELLPTGLSWTEEERSHWAFKPLQRPPIPAVQHPQQVLDPLDAFLLVELEKEGRTFSPHADRITFIRRLSFDLLGCPPDPSSVQQFVNDTSEDAHSALVDRILASPEYGERWGRNWLDAAGYADSDGYTEADAIRPWAYRYRDYVIASLNQDKPWNSFVVEQLAGDELLSQPFENLTPEAAEKLTATGFLRMAPDGTGDAGVDMNVARNDVVADTIKIVSTSMLGLTVGCAQCHNHRYDPISQADYYRIRALFEPALDWKNWRDKPSKLISLWQSSDKEKASQVDSEMAKLEESRLKELDEIVLSIFERQLAKLPEERRALGKEAKDTAADKRTDEHKAILKEFPSLNVDRGSATLYEPAKIDEFNKRYEKLQGEIKAKKPADSFVACLFEPVGHLPPTHLFSRGDIHQPREMIEPGDLSILAQANEVPVDDPSLPTSGRRLAIAKLWTNGIHPLLPRAIVNRVWMHHFGRGISNTPGDFGTLGESPSHPELLDWLTTRFIESGWQLKALHRSIVLSHAYRQRSIRPENYDAFDPENRKWGHMNLRRLEAETIRDSMLEMTGKMARIMYGPPVPVNPDDVGQAIIGNAVRDGNGILVAKAQEDVQQYRRSIYLQVRRSLPFGMLESFDSPATVPNCDRRTQSTVAPQSLLLMNNPYTIQYAERFAENLVRLAGPDTNEQVRTAWRMAFAEEASEDESRSAVEWIQSQKAFFDQVASASPPADAATAAARGSALTSEVQALALFCQAVFSSNRFLYVD